MSIDRWMDKEDVVYIYMEYYSAIKKEWNNAIWSNMDGPRDYHTKWTKTDEDKYHKISLIHGILKNGTNEFIYKTNRLIDVENKLMVTKDKAGGINWECGINRYTLQYIK